MNIKVEFLNGSQYWKDKITANAAQSSKVLNDPAFLAKVRAWPGFDYTSDTSEQIADKLENAGVVSIKVGFYSKWWTRAIAYESNGAVFFNTRKENYGAGGTNNLIHEALHSLGYSHRGNSPNGNENTVPWRVSEIAMEFIHVACKA